MKFFGGSSRDRDRLISWRMQHPRMLRNITIGKINKGEPFMQRQFSIELRVDYADNEKNEVMRQALQKAARHMFATAMLLRDTVKPQIAIYSDDFFDGHEAIALIEDDVQKGLDDLGGEQEETVSSDLMNAMKDGI